MGDIAKGTTPRTDIAHDHEGSRTLGKALTQIRAGGFLANGVEIIFAQACFQLLDAIAGRRFGANPCRLALHRYRRHHLDRYTRELVGTL